MRDARLSKSGRTCRSADAGTSKRFEPMAHHANIVLRVRSWFPGLFPPAGDIVIIFVLGQGVAVVSSRVVVL